MTTDGNNTPTPMTAESSPRTKTTRGVAASLDLAGFSGLSSADVAQRFQNDGPNELPSQKQRGIAAIALEVVREPMFLLLVAAGVLYLLLGEVSDALMLLGFVVVVMTITIIQERRTERALDALRDLSSPRALVIRDGVHKRIPGREVVRGDILILAEGDRVPADILLRRGINLTIDESLLTGESVPVRKLPREDISTLERPGGEDIASVFSGTLVTAGQGVGEVISIGGATELGKIGKALQEVESEDTLLQRETSRLVRQFAVVGLSACVVVIIGYALTRGGGWHEWKQGMLAGIAMAMAILPEEFPVVLTVFLALGAWRISRSRVLTRRMPAVETLGAATVLCVDKTGTLTENQMALKSLSVDGRPLTLTDQLPQLSEEYHAILEMAILASKRDPFDPMERALHQAGDRWLRHTEHLHPEWTMQCEYPLASDLLAVSQAWRQGDSDELVVASKGAPESIADLCHLSTEQTQAVMRHVSELASQGLRVLAVARGHATAGDLPTEHHGLDLKFIGLLGLQDPLRQTVPDAIQQCRNAGIRVVMITGDSPDTARSIARQASLAHPENVITGTELATLPGDALADRIRSTNVFARVVPEQKLRIVNALKAAGEIVAMTGDGVNDAPALRAAHIGIAMGGRGTDVAREAASLVLLDDDFSSIVAAVRLGRRIFDNIKKAIAFILAVHVPIAGLSMLPVFFSDWPLLLLPIHIVFLELVIDPSCSLVFEAERAEADIMDRPPRDPNERLFSMHTLGIALIQGLTVLAACVGVFVAARNGHADMGKVACEDTARALTFTTLVIAFVGIILCNRSWTRPLLQSLAVRNRALWVVIAGTATMLAAVLFVPAVQNIFHFAPLHHRDLLGCIGVGVACIGWFELLNAFRRRKHTSMATA